MTVIYSCELENNPALEAVRQTRKVRFGVFEADLGSGELRKHGLKIKLRDQPFQVLALLLERPGEVVTREELRQKLWPADTFVDVDVGLNTIIRRLRDALGDSAESPRYIETLPRRGYRFLGAVDSLGAFTVPEVKPISPRRLWRAFALMVALIVLLAALVGLDAGGVRSRLFGKPLATSIRSIAVIPLEDLTGDAGQEYFADGMTDALITNLAQISSLRVISRTSVMRYKGSKKALQEIGKELNVDGIVEGTLVRSGERLRVDTQLIEASTDRHVWAASYERDFSDVITLQNEIARAVANELQVKLTSQERAHLLRAEPIDPQTYELYLKGRYFWGKLSIQKSIDYFQQAIQRDPNYALAYAAMAEAYTGSDLPPVERYSRAKSAARKALQLDETLAEAHNALAACLFWHDWDFTGAEKEFHLALALNPNYAQAHQWYGRFQHAMGRQNWAAENKLAGQLDPLSLSNAGGGWYIESGQYDLAIEIQRKKLELDPNFALAYFMLGRVYTLKGMYQDAIAQIQKAVSLSGGAPGYLSFLGYTYGVSGRRDEARKVLQQLTLLSKRRYVSPYDIARILVGLDEKDLAFDWLQKAFADRSDQLVFLKVDTEMRSMRSDPRYTDLIRRIGLPL